MTSNPLDGNWRRGSNVTGPEYFGEAIVNRDSREVKERGGRGHEQERKSRLVSMLVRRILHTANSFVGVPKDSMYAGIQYIWYCLCI